MAITEADENRGDTSSPRIDFKVLRDEFSFDKIWRSRAFGNICSHFAQVLLIGLIPSFFDLVTDSLNAKNFILGNYYIKHIHNMSEFDKDSCTHVGTYIRYRNPEKLNISEDISNSRFLTDLEIPEVVFEEVSCFEVDPTWGWLTFSFILLPGFGLTLNIAILINHHTSGKKGWALIPLIMPFACALFPVLLVVVKIITLVNPGSEWEKVVNSITAIEGRWESSFQLILTLFIILSRADRTPSSQQYASLVASLLMIVKVNTANFVKEDPSENERQRTITLVPLFLTITVFKFGSVAITMALLRYYTIPLYIGVFVLFHVIGCKSKTECQMPTTPGFTTIIDGALGLTKFRTYIDREGLIHKTETRILEELVFRNKFWFSVHILVLVIIAVDINLFSFSILNFLNESCVLKDHFLKDIWLFDTLFIVILACGLASAGLFYIQVWIPATKTHEALQEHKVRHRDTN